MEWTQVCYSYDGSFAGFLCCVFNSYAHHEIPACFSTPDDPRVSLWPERIVERDQTHAGRVYRSLAEKISPDAQRLVERGFLTCLDERELCLWHFIRTGLRRGGEMINDLTCDEVRILRQAVRHLEHEAHLLKGFARFAQIQGVLVAQITPKNRVLPLLRPHFCARYPDERIVIYDRTHAQILAAQRGEWAILPAENFRPGALDGEEQKWQELWRRFYHTIAIQGRENPRCRMSQMPKRFWGDLTELQTCDEALRTGPEPISAQPRRKFKKSEKSLDFSRQLYYHSQAPV